MKLTMVMKQAEKDNAGLCVKCAGVLELGDGRAIDVVALEKSPCSDSCPLDTNVKAYISLAAAGRFEEALEVARLNNPFPGICGRVCTHPCETACGENSGREPLSIAALKRFLADYELQRGIIPRYRTERPRGPRVAVIGAGPAGLACAAACARFGYDVTVFEALPVPGGMLAVGIPEYRLPRDILALEIKAIESLGVKIRLNSRVGHNLTLSGLRREFEAICIAVGAQKSAPLGLAGEDEAVREVVAGIDLLRNAALSGKQEVGRDVVVIGGGNTAIDAARTALRLGAEKVRLLYRRSRSEMPALAEEVDDALAEGVEMHLLCAPAKLLHSPDGLTGIGCIRMELGSPDSDGRARPVPIEGSGFEISCDMLIPAVGQLLDPAVVDPAEQVDLSDKKFIGTDPATMQTSAQGIFAAGDAALGPATVVDAIASGQKAATAIHKMISGEGDALREPPREIELTLKPEAPNRRGRVSFSRLGTEKRSASFNEVNQSYTEFEAIDEARRCERCGPCVECVSCVGSCSHRQLVVEPVKDGMPALPQLLRANRDLHETVQSQQETRLKLGKSEFVVSSLLADVDDRFCRGCGLCEEACPFHAIRVTCKRDGEFVAMVDAAACAGCGKCVPVCPSGALDQEFFSNERIDRLVSECLRDNGGGIVVFTTLWDAAAAADEFPRHVIAGTSRQRIGAGHVLSAFERGAAGVVVLESSESRRRYTGTAWHEAEVDGMIRNVLPLAGIDPERFCSIDEIDDIGLIKKKFLSLPSVKRRLT